MEKRIKMNKLLLLLGFVTVSSGNVIQAHLNVTYHIVNYGTPTIQYLYMWI